MLFNYILNAVCYRQDYSNQLPSIFLRGGSLNSSPFSGEFKFREPVEFNSFGMERDLKNKDDVNDTTPFEKIPVLRTIIISKRMAPMQSEHKELPFMGRELFGSGGNRGIEKSSFNNAKSNKKGHNDYYNSYKKNFGTNNYNADEGIPFRSANSFEDAVKDRPDTKSRSTGWLRLFKAFMYLILLGIAGMFGFYFGKLQESRNYVRVGVPPSN